MNERGNTMATILVDFENIKNLQGVDLLNEKDTLILFYSESSRHIDNKFIHQIFQSGCSFRTIKLERAGKNALDFYIATECGILSKSGETEIGILSADNGFQAVIDFFKAERINEHVRIRKATNIWDLILSFSPALNAARQETIRSMTGKSNLDELSTKIKTYNDILEKIKRLLVGTNYENRTADIIDFLNSEQFHKKHEIYTKSLHTFGKEDGIEIYKILKDEIKISNN